MVMHANFRVIAVLLLLATGLSACDQPGPAEQAGKKVDQVVNEAGKKIGEAADKVDKALIEQSTKAVQVIDDTEITARVKAVFFAESGLKAMRIDVDTVNGVVTLSGIVDSPSTVERAGTLAAAVGGVKEVNSRLTVAAGR